MIVFNQPTRLGTEIDYLQQVIATNQLAGNGKFTHLCEDWFVQHFGTKRALLTPSCTAALELAAIILDIQAGDEVIMPSYTFVSTANAFVLRGAKIVFVDITPETMNIDAQKIEQAITPRTKAIVPVHYAGVACNMEMIMALAQRYHLWVVEDAAQAVMARYQNRALGTLGHIGCFSFHETKNYTAGGEGGAILLNDARLIERAEIIREKGTDRQHFFRGQVDKYTWRDLGSSFLPSELQSAYLYAQLQEAERVNRKRLDLWQNYFRAFSLLAKKGWVELPKIPKDCQPNGHLFWLKLPNYSERTEFIAYLKQNDILTVFHYIPLHSSPAGQRFGYFVGEDRFTTQESERLVRLPLFYNLSQRDQQRVIDTVLAYFGL